MIVPYKKVYPIRCRGSEKDQSRNSLILDTIRKAQQGSETDILMEDVYIALGDPAVVVLPGISSLFGYTVVGDIMDLNKTITDPIFRIDPESLPVERWGGAMAPRYEEIYTLIMNNDKSEGDWYFAASGNVLEWLEKQEMKKDSMSKVPEEEAN